jgi:hypothetical protein
MRLLGILAFYAGVAHAEPAPFSGTWTGKGHWFNASREIDVATDVTLAIAADDSSFRFEECWDYRERNGDPRHSCINGAYDRRADALFHDEKRVGDVYPDRVIIYEGNSQVGEQIVMELTKTGDLHYRYSYLNADGAEERREVQLTPVR